MTPAPLEGLIRNARLVTLDGEDGPGLVEHGVLAWREGIVVHAGPATTLAPLGPSEVVIDAAGALVTPMMIESGLDPAAQLTVFFRALQEKRAQDASTVTQALRALTVEAAARHGLSDRGRLIPTLRADFILWHARQLDDLSEGPARDCFDSAWAAGIRLP